MPALGAREPAAEAPLHARALAAGAAEAAVARANPPEPERPCGATPGWRERMLGLLRVANPALLALAIEAALPVREVKAAEGARLCEPLLAHAAVEALGLAGAP